MNKVERILGMRMARMFGSDDTEEQSVMASSNHLNYLTATNTNDLGNNSKQLDCIERDSTETDLFYLSEKSKAYRINEWQAAWNVTNAIQVFYSICIKLEPVLEF